MNFGHGRQPVQAPILEAPASVAHVFPASSLCGCEQRLAQTGDAGAVAPVADGARDFDEAVHAQLAVGRARKADAAGAQPLRFGRVRAAMVVGELHGVAGTTDERAAVASVCDPQLWQQRSSALDEHCDQRCRS
jgi:hypothetical protein